MSDLHGIRVRVLRAFKRAERPAAWILLAGAFVTFVGVVVGYFTVGEAKLATILVAASLLVEGLSAVQEAED